MQTAIEHDLEDSILIGEEGKKCNRGEMEDSTGKEESDNAMARCRRTVNFNLV